MEKQGILHSRLDGANVTRDVFIDRERNLLYFYPHVVVNGQTTFTFFFWSFDHLLLAFHFTLLFSLSLKLDFLDA